MAYLPPDPLYIYCPPPQIYFVDKDTGTPLAAGEVYFYEDLNRTVKKSIYKQVQLPDLSYQFVELNNPVILTSVGTFADDSGNDIDVYLWPYENPPGSESQGAIELYYLEVYSSGGTLQFTREAWPPDVGTGIDNIINYIPSANLLTNPQFVDLTYIPDPTTNIYTHVVGAGTTTIPLAPSWDLVVSATTSGTITVQRTQITDGAIESQPPYALQISSTGLSDIILRQTLTASPRLAYDANGLSWLAPYMVARSVSPSGAINITMTYKPSAGSNYSLIDNTINNSFQKLAPFAVAIDDVVNANPAPGGFVNVDISWLPNSTVEITSLQLVNVANEGSVVNYVQQSTPEQENHLAYAQIPELEYKASPNYALGWDFRYNPGQELGAAIGTSGLGNNTAWYICDQTIAFESVGDAMNYDLTNGGLDFTPSSDTQFALVQYLPINTAYELLSAPTLCLQISGATNAIQGAPLQGYVSLYWTDNPNLPSVPISANNATIFTSLSGGIPQGIVSGWNVITNPYGVVVGGANTNCVPFQLTEVQDVYGWEQVDFISIAAAKFFAIVVSFDTVVATGRSNIVYITLHTGSVTSPPAAMNNAEVLSALEYYYETSYNAGVPVGTNDLSGALERQMTAYANGGNTTWGATSFGLHYNNIKRTTPTVSFYTPGGVVGNLRAAVYTSGVSSGSADAPISGGGTIWSAADAGEKGVIYDSLNNTPAVSAGGTTQPISGNVTFHYVADARLGEVN